MTHLHSSLTPKRTFVREEIEERSRQGTRYHLNAARHPKHNRTFPSGLW
jgi:hypothetical protein